MPEGVDLPQAASVLNAYGTSCHALKDRAELQPGETLLVLGAAGGVGLAAVELGAMMGATVIAAASTDKKLAVCREHGASLTINYETEDLKLADPRAHRRRGAPTSSTTRSAAATPSPPCARRRGRAGSS